MKRSKGKGEKSLMYFLKGWLPEWYNAAGCSAPPWQCVGLDSPEVLVYYWNYWWAWSPFTSLYPRPGNYIIIRKIKMPKFNIFPWWRIFPFCFVKFIWPWVDIHTRRWTQHKHAFSFTVCAQPLREADLRYLALIQDQETLMWI